MPVNTASANEGILSSRAATACRQPGLPEKRKDSQTSEGELPVLVAAGVEDGRAVEGHGKPPVVRSVGRAEAD